MSGILNNPRCLIPRSALDAAGGAGTGTQILLAISVGLEGCLAVRLRPRLALAVAGAASLALLRGADPNAQLGLATDAAGKGRVRNAKRRGDLPKRPSGAARGHELLDRDRIQFPNGRHSENCSPGCGPAPKGQQLPAALPGPVGAGTAIQARSRPHAGGEGVFAAGDAWTLGWGDEILGGRE